MIFGCPLMKRPVGTRNVWGKRSPTVSPWAGMKGPLGTEDQYRTGIAWTLACLPVLTERLISAHGASVGKVQQKSPCVPTGRFIETLASCSMIFVRSLMKRPVGTRNVWGKHGPTVSPWAEMMGPVGDRRPISNRNRMTLCLPSRPNRTIDFSPRSIRG